MGSGSHTLPARYARICAALSVDDDPPPSMPPGPASAGRVQEAVRHARQAVPNSRLERPELPPERAGRPEYLQRRSSLTARSSRSARRGGPRRCARREGPGGDGELGRVTREEGEAAAREDALLVHSDLPLGQHEVLHFLTCPRRRAVQPRSVQSLTSLVSS